MDSFLAVTGDHIADLERRCKAADPIAADSIAAVKKPNVNDMIKHNLLDFTSSLVTGERHDAPPRPAPPGEGLTRSSVGGPLAHSESRHISASQSPPSVELDPMRLQTQLPARSSHSLPIISTMVPNPAASAGGGHRLASVQCPLPRIDSVNLLDFSVCSCIMYVC